MPLGAVSGGRLATCHPDLRRFVDAVAEGIDAGELATAGVRDVTVLCGHRGKAEQDKAFADGASKLRWPNSKHNQTPSLAVDLAPYPIDWNNVAAFDVLRGYALGVAARLGIKLRVISWDRPHFELLG
jgi:peptidoglycan L-alanyl-D-glutamate endopeptidase CwlK